MRVITLSNEIEYYYPPSIKNEIEVSTLLLLFVSVTDNFFTLGVNSLVLS